jgi:NADH-quinone oxidoreductase subunit C
MAEQAAPAVVEALDAALRERFGEAIGERRARHEMPEWSVAAPALAQVCAWLKAEQGLNHLVLLSTVDRGERLEVVYFLDAMPTPPPYQRLVLRVSVDRADPRVPTVSGVWAAANWHEREAWDLMGIVFEGHPDPRRLLLPDVWEGHPLRKDYTWDADTMVDAILEAELGPRGEGS